MSDKEVAPIKQLTMEELNKENIQKQNALKETEVQNYQKDMYASLVKKIYVVIEY